jgi:orotate phosphoribosyltransferase
MEALRLIAQALLDSGSVKISLNPLFTWASGIRSPIYCDLRALISDVPTRRMIVAAFKQMREEWMDVDGIAGTATAGIPWAAWLAEAVGKPMVYVRGSAKDHGTRKRIEGALKPGQKFLLVEDHISTGGSSVSAVEALRQEGGVIVDEVLAINTYQLDQADLTFKAAGLSVQTLTNYETILSVAKQRGLIDDEKEILLSEFRADPSTVHSLF